MAVVYRKPEEDVEHLIKRFNKKVQKDGILFEGRKKQYYVSKSQQRRIDKQKADRKYKKLWQTIN